MLARLQEDVRTASSLPDYRASLGKGVLSAYQEKRVTPFSAEVGLTNRVSLSVYVPIVRVATRTGLQLSQGTANLGANPLATDAAAVQRYQTFFGQFSNALTQLSANIAGGQYGCPSSPACTQARDFLAYGTSVQDALLRTIYGVGSVQTPFVPLAGSPAGAGIDSSVARLQRQLATAYNVTGFGDSLLLPTDTLSAPLDFAAFLGSTVGSNGSVFGFGYNPFRNTWRYGLGNVEVEAKYRVVDGPHYAAALAVLGRLPTATRDSTLEVLDVSIADLGPGVEGRVIQELTLAKRIWLNLAVRVGTELTQTRAQRVAPFDAFLVPFQATTVLDWKGGNYAAIDFAPLYRLAPGFAVGFTVGYWTKAADHYSYRTTQDSMQLATQLGAPIPANVLDGGTSQQWVRLGGAVTFTGSAVEAGFSVEQTVSGEGGLVPRAMVYQLRFRISRKLF
jgi:hypothetical protein